ncbi:YqzE family protein [Risungbinella massiliensis]|uniref:YqzE family protein n=1 Tax=Risungbinella massiliensis TaxID=1329796 RepID=UPI0005CBEC71|nr:YqzE family protein [Risungbinella massiliensis]
MSFKDWISYMIEKMLWYVETPKDERKAHRQAQKEPFMTRWFGMIPFSTKMYLEKQKDRLQGLRLSRNNRNN